MERTTIMLPHDLKAKASKKAEKMGMSLGQYVREAITNSLNTDPNEQPIDDPLFSDNAVFHGKTPKDLVQNLDDYLYGEQQ
jgi:hypothetical protein